MSQSDNGPDRDYVIGVNDAEIERLGSQHATWRTQALEAWQKAGLTAGMKVADIGCGPGYATLDLAEIVGPDGSVLGVDQSRTFLDVLTTRAATMNLAHVKTMEASIEEMQLEPDSYDLIWCRWVLSFLPDPEAALVKMVNALKPGGKIVLQEYGVYRTFRIHPYDPILDKFMDGVEDSWVKSGGDTNVARRLPTVLDQTGCQDIEVTPLIFAARKGEPFWNWPWDWINQAPDRIMELGSLSREDAEAFRAYLKMLDETEFAWLTTPGVYQILAEKPA